MNEKDWNNWYKLDNVSPENSCTSTEVITPNSEMPCIIWNDMDIW